MVTFKVFAKSEQSNAEELRLDIELDQNRKKIDHELVLLDAANQAALRQTHVRYVYDPLHILELIRGAIA